MRAEERKFFFGGESWEEEGFEKSSDEAKGLSKKCFERRRAEEEYAQRLQENKRQGEREREIE